MTVIIDLTPVKYHTGPARLLDMVPGRSKQVFQTWLAAHPQAWRDGIEIVAMDGFTGFKTATNAELPDAVTVMDPLVVKLATDAVDACRRRVHQTTTGHRGRRDKPLHQTRRTLLTEASLITDKQTNRLTTLFADHRHSEVEATWDIYQRLIQAYRAPKPKLGRWLMTHLIDAINTNIPIDLIENRHLGRTLKRRATDILAYFDHPATSNEPTEAINSRLGHLRSTALSFHNPTNYITHSLLETGGFKPHLHPQTR